jgi:hypothetical protein
MLGPLALAAGRSDTDTASTTPRPASMPARALCMGQSTMHMRAAALRGAFEKRSALQPTQNSVLNCAHRCALPVAQSRSNLKCYLVLRIKY